LTQEAALRVSGAARITGSSVSSLGITLDDETITDGLVSTAAYSPKSALFGEVLKDVVDLVRFGGDAARREFLMNFGH
jgi:hypothetical protein